MLHIVDAISNAKVVVTCRNGVACLLFTAMVLSVTAITDQSLAQSTGPSTSAEAVEENNSSAKPDSDTADSDEKSTASDEELGSHSWSEANFPGFIDIRQRIVAPDERLLEKGLRLITSDNFAPFNSRPGAGAPEGYHIELAKLLCEELNIACTMKVVPFDQIPNLLEKGAADAALAGLLSHPDLVETIGFSTPYLFRPARFVRLKENFLRVSPNDLADKPIAVQGRSAHEAYLKAYFPKVKRIAVADLQDATRLLLEKKVTALFADAMQIAPLMAQKDAKLIFAGKPFFDDYFFGEGMSIAYQRQQSGLRALFDYGLIKLARSGRLAELYVRHFPVDVYAVY